MTRKSLRSCLETFALMILGGFLGSVFALLAYELPLGTISYIGASPDTAVDIMYVDYHYPAAGNFDKNILYFQNSTQEIVFGPPDSWKTLLPLPDDHVVKSVWREHYGTYEGLVAKADNGASYRLIGDRWERIMDPSKLVRKGNPYHCSSEWMLPVFQVQDSEGRVFSHALADDYVCYILRNDGRIQVWSRTRDAFSLLFSLLIGAGVGAVIGINYFRITDFLKRKLRRSR